eukprot:COSAG01_NODE_4520_length_4959_cov_4.342181_5_plen_208_part_00
MDDRHALTPPRPRRAGKTVQAKQRTERERARRRLGWLQQPLLGKPLPPTTTTTEAAAAAAAPPAIPAAATAQQVWPRHSAARPTLQPSEGNHGTAHGIGARVACCSCLGGRALLLSHVCAWVICMCAGVCCALLAAAAAAQAAADLAAAVATLRQTHAQAKVIDLSAAAAVAPCDRNNLAQLQSQKLQVRPRQGREQPHTRCHARVA